MASTTNNGWATPDDTSLVKDGASAIRTLGSAIDTSVGTGLLAWTSWAPALSVGWANGNGTYTAVYSQLGKIVNVYILFTVGSTTTKGTGMTMSLPVTAKASRLNGIFPIRASVAGSPYALTGRFNTTTTFEIEAMNAGFTYLGQGTQITSAIPGTWATGNTVAMTFTYEAA